MKQKLISIAFAVLGAVAAPAVLAQTASSISAPIPGNLDSRIVTFAYTPDVVYKLPVTVGMHTHIALGSDEELIEIPRIGDKVRWRIEGNEKNLYIKATAGETTTSLSLVTSKRVYQFELVATSKGAERIQKAVFSYPDDEEGIKIRARQSYERDRNLAQQKVAALAGQNLSSESIDPVELRFLTVETENQAFAGMHAYTDGVRTYMRMPAGIQDLPAVFMAEANERGKELLMPVNYTIADRKSVRDRDAIVIDRTAPVWVLQIGKSASVRVLDK